MMISGSAVHFCLVMIFTKVFGWGFTGVCIATSLQFVVRFFVSHIQVNYLTPGLRNKHGAILFSKESTVNIAY